MLLIVLHKNCSRLERSSVGHRSVNFMKGERNTFQAVLATDGNTSFAIFIYPELEWYQSEVMRMESESGSGENRGDSGTSGTNPLRIRSVYT